MKTVTKEYKVYQFSELSQTAQDKVMNDLIVFYMEAVPYEQMSPDMQAACDKSEQMQTPWFCGSYIYDFCKSELLSELADKEYLENGELFNS